MESLIEKAFENVLSEDESQENYESEPVREASSEEAVSEPSNDVSQRVKEEFDLECMSAKILVVGAGGGGNNAISRLTEIGVKGANTVAVNTDAKHLSITKADKKVLIGRELTKGLGAGGYPSVGRKAAEEIDRYLGGTGDIDVFHSVSA